jgi:hypothetical protein
VPGDVLLSCEDLVGPLPGRGGGRRVYPRITGAIMALRKALPEVELRTYFFCRAPERWLRSVYVQNLRHRRRHSGFDSFHARLADTDAVWDGVLRRPRQRLGDSFVEIDYAEGTGFCAATALFDRVTGRPGAVPPAPGNPRPNRAPPPEIVALMEAANGSGASPDAIRAAKSALLADGPDAPAPKPSTPGRSDGAATVPADASATKTPRPAWLSPALDPLWARAATRRARQVQPWLLPDPEADLTALRRERVIGPVTLPEAGRADMEDQAQILAHRFRGLPRTCWMLGMTISYLRRDTDHSVAAASLFHRLWREEAAILLGFLPTRWLISSFQTFAEHGETAPQRKAGTAAFFLANTLKLYETERGLDGLQPRRTYPHAEPQGRGGFRGLDRFRLGGSDLAINTLALLLDLAARDAVSGRPVQEFLLRLRAAHTAFSRMDRSRIAHGIENPRFSDCWSFGTPPED